MLRSPRARHSWFLTSDQEGPKTKNTESILEFLWVPQVTLKHPMMAVQIVSCEQSSTYLWNELYCRACTNICFRQMTSLLQTKDEQRGVRVFYIIFLGGKKVEVKRLMLSFGSRKYREQGERERGSRESLMCECSPSLFSKAHSCVSNVYRSVRRTHMDIKITPVCGCPWLVMLTEPLNDRIRLLICVQFRLTLFNTGPWAVWVKKVPFFSPNKKKKVFKVWLQHLDICLTGLVRTSSGHEY